MARTPDMFEKLPRRKARVLMHVADAGQDMIRFECYVCGHDTGWIPDEITITDAKRGIPCPECNK